MEKLIDMKKLISLLFFVILATSFFSCLPENDPLEITTEHILTIAAPDNLFTSVQGATFDGEYYYVAFVNKYLPYETAIILKTDKNGNEVKRSEVLPLDHQQMKSRHTTQN